MVLDTKLRLSSPPVRTSAVPRATVAVENAVSNSLTTLRRPPRPALEPPRPPIKLTKLKAQFNEHLVDIRGHLRRVLRRGVTVLSSVPTMLRTLESCRFSTSANAFGAAGMGAGRGAGTGAGAGSATGWAKTLEATAIPTKRGLKKRMLKLKSSLSREDLLRWSIGSMSIQLDFEPFLYVSEN